MAATNTFSSGAFYENVVLTPTGEAKLTYKEKVAYKKKLKQERIRLLREDMRRVAAQRAALEQDVQDVDFSE